MWNLVRLWCCRTLHLPHKLFTEGILAARGFLCLTDTSQAESMKMPDGWQQHWSVLMQMSRLKWTSVLISESVLWHHGGRASVRRSLMKERGFLFFDADWQGSRFEASRVSWKSISDVEMIRDAFDVGWGRQLKGHVSEAAACILMRQKLFPPLKIAVLASQIFNLWEWHHGDGVDQKRWWSHFGFAPMQMMQLRLQLGDVTSCRDNVPVYGNLCCSPGRRGEKFNLTSASFICISDQSADTRARFCNPLLKTSESYTYFPLRKYYFTSVYGTLQLKHVLPNDPGCCGD